MILIDDGSTDSSGRVCDEYAKKDQRIKVYHQPNKGLLTTRRMAISKASGDFCLFLDSDDYWEPDLLDTINQVICEFNCDMVIYKYKKVTENGSYISESSSLFKDRTVFDYRNKEMLFNKIISGSELNTLCLKAVKYNIIDIDKDYSLFYIIKNAEDLLQTLPLIYNAQRIVYLGKPLYNYRMQRASITHTINTHLIDDITTVREIVLQYMKRMSIDSEKNLKALYKFYVERILAYIKRLIISDITKKEKEDILYSVKDIPLYIRALQYIDIDNFSFGKRLLLYLINKRYTESLIMYGKAICFLIRLKGMIK